MTEGSRRVDQSRDEEPMTSWLVSSWLDVHKMSGSNRGRPRTNEKQRRMQSQWKACWRHVMLSNPATTHFPSNTTLTLFVCNPRRTFAQFLTILSSRTRTAALIKIVSSSITISHWIITFACLVLRRATKLNCTNCHWSIGFGPSSLTTK